MASAPKGVRVYVKKQIVLDRLSYSQQDMLKLGTVAKVQIKNRVALGIGPTDGPAKPLSKKWAAIKRNMHLKPVRDLRGTGYAFGNALTRAAKRKKTGKRFIGQL